MTEFEFDGESVRRIEAVIHRYPICLKECADLLECITPFLEVMPGRDAVNRVRYYVLEDRRICREQEMLLAVRPKWNE